MKTTSDAEQYADCGAAWACCSDVTAVPQRQRVVLERTKRHERDRHQDGHDHELDDGEYDEVRLTGIARQAELVENQVQAEQHRHMPQV